MERTKATQLVTKYINDLWPKWTLTWNLQEEWIGLVLPYTEEDAKSAITQMLRLGKSSEYTFPIEREFRKYIRSIMDGKPKPAQRVVDASTVVTMWLICTRRGGLGAWPGHAIHCQPGTSQEKAQKLAAEYEGGIIGGKWETFKGNRTEALARGREIKAKAESVPEEPLLDQPAEEPKKFDPSWAMPKEKDEIPF